MNPEIRQQWKEALLSGKYKQGKRALCRKEPDGSVAYCCLGILCELAIKAGIPLDKHRLGDSSLYSYNKAPTYLPAAVITWATLVNCDPIANDGILLSEHNDKVGSTFKQIAELLPE